MPSCLGLYIENNLIKYAKVTKNNEDIKVESFGVKFYENINVAIKQIVEETYSFKIPISINTTDEWYNNIEVFSLLNAKDMNSAIKTEFENICFEKEINKNIYEQRHIFTNSSNNEDKIKAIHISVPKTSIEQRKNQFSEYKISNISPLSISISNLAKKEKKGTSLIVNIEKNTAITKITNGIVSDIEIINAGAQDIFDKINQKENSYAKSYEICKRATIYTETDRDLQYEENEYLEDIMPTLFQIVSKIRKNVEESLDKIDNIYITGTGALVNNIDIYFQDYLNNIHCEILKPSFVNSNSKINIKDYIEVNSAISLGLIGVEKNSQNINFKGETSTKKIATLANESFSNIRESKITQKVGGFFDSFSRQIDFTTVLTVTIVAMYFTGVILINNQYKKIDEELDASINETNSRISEIQGYEEEIEEQITTYESLIKNIQNLSDTNSEDRRYRNTIPNLLNNIMVVIPKGVQLVSIQNPSGEQIKIEAKSASYEEIAFFKAKLKTEGILKNVVSDTGTKVDDYLNVTIEGDLP